MPPPAAQRSRRCGVAPPRHQRQRAPEVGQADGLDQVVIEAGLGRLHGYIAKHMLVPRTAD